MHLVANIINEIIGFESYVLYCVCDFVYMPSDQTEYTSSCVPYCVDALHYQCACGKE